MHGPPLDHHERAHGDGRGAKEAEHNQMRPAELVPQAQAEQGGDRGGGERARARVVDRLAFEPRRLVQDRDCHQQREQGQRRLHDEDRPPADGVDERASGHEADDRRARADQRPPSHGLDSVLLGERAHDQRHRRRAGRRARDRAERADRDERRPVPRERGQERGDGEAGEPDDVHAAVAADVADLAEQRH
jgi:hypothetical protein